MSLKKVYALNGIDGLFDVISELPEEVLNKMLPKLALLLKETLDLVPESDKKEMLSLYPSNEEFIISKEQIDIENTETYLTELKVKYDSIPGCYEGFPNQAIMESNRQADIQQEMNDVQSKITNIKMLQKIRLERLSSGLFD